MKIIQINFHHAITATALIETVLRRQRIDIALIQEPWVNNNTIKGLNIPGYELIFDAWEKRPRTCILAKRTLKFVGLSEYWSQDLTTIQVTGRNNEEIILAAAYMPGEMNDAPPSEVKKLIKWGYKKKLPLIIGADCNAHHIAWGSTNINSRGERLLEYLGSTVLLTYKSNKEEKTN